MAVIPLFRDPQALTGPLNSFMMRFLTVGSGSVWDTFVPDTVLYLYEVRLMFYVYCRSNTFYIMVNGVARLGWSSFRGHAIHGTMLVPGSVQLIHSQHIFKLILPYSMLG